MYIPYICKGPRENLRSLSSLKADMFEFDIDRQTYIETYTIHWSWIIITDGHFTASAPRCAKNEPIFGNYLPSWCEKCQKTTDLETSFLS